MKNNKQIRLLPKTPFSFRDALNLGLTKYALKKYVAEGLIEKLGRGVYQLSDRADRGDTFTESQYQTATIRCGCLPVYAC